MFEEANKALEQSLSTENSEAPVTNESTEVKADNQPVATLPELEKLERFKYDGREWTPADLKSAVMMQKDYTQKTQEISQERKYYDNLAADLKYVRENPTLANEFRKIYPEKFHSYLDFAAATQQQAGQQHQNVQGQPQQVQLPPEFQNLKKDFDQLRTAWSSQETEKEMAKIDNIFQTMGKKYEHADERTVLATAQAAYQQGLKQNGDGYRLTDAQWEQIFKSEHERSQARYESFYKNKISQQQEANKKARDAGPGGGTPGQAPPKRSFKEATADAIAHFEGR